MEKKDHNLDTIQNMIEVKHACHEGKWCPHCNGTDTFQKCIFMCTYACTTFTMVRVKYLKMIEIGLDKV